MISTHVLDTTLGRPASGIKVQLEKQGPGDKWSILSEEQTNDDGRIVFKCPAEPGTYRLQFQIESYFKKSATAHFFVAAPLIFAITDTSRKYHVPLLLNPYGYSTYRGS